MAAPNMHVNVSGTWKQVNKVHVNVSGTWKQVNKVHVNVAGVWKLAHTVADYQRDTLAMTNASTQYVGGSISDVMFPPPSYEGTGVQLPSGWSRQTVGSTPNLTTALVQHPAPAWVPANNNIHSVAGDFAMLNYSFQSAGFHTGLLSRHPGLAYNTVGNRCSAAVVGTYAGLNYALALENIEFGPAGGAVRDPWTVGSVWPGSNDLIRRIEVHTRWQGGVSSSRAIMRANRGGAVLQDSGWIAIGGSYPSTFSDLSRCWVGNFFVLGTHTSDAYAFSNIRSSWSSGDAPLLTDL